MTRWPVAFALVTLVLCPSLSNAQARGRAAGAGPSSGSTPRAAAAMPATLISQLVELGAHGSVLPNITHQAGRIGTNLVVSSNRLEIARHSAEAAAASTTYAPAADERRDEVKITCLDTRERFAVDCDRVVVLIDEKAVPALRATGGPHTLTNDRGATWQRRGVEAFYSAAALKSGFVVTALAPDRQSWTLVVTPEDAAERLLLGTLPAAH